MNYEIKKDGGVTDPQGFTASGVHCGLRKNTSKKDLALVYSESKCTSAAVFTKNLVKGAPIYVTKENIDNGTPNVMICNSGNANTCNADGINKAKEICKALGEILNINEKDVIIASTGVIGQILDSDKIINALPKLKRNLSVSGANDAANAIMTTDTKTKHLSVSFTLDEKKVTIGGMAKGSGMIHPNMATMLCFITTDCLISKKMLQKALSEVVDDTFNMISVDGDTSTNDMVSILANGNAKNTEINDFGSDYNIFKNALFIIMRELSKMIAGDGEGATHLIECQVINASDKKIAKTISKSVISSNLVKCAIFGADANWGRILCAIGYSGVYVDIEKVNVSISSEKGEMLVCKKGSGVNFFEDRAKDILLCHDIKINIDLNSGKSEAVAWGCDLSYEYVKINGDYRT